MENMKKIILITLLALAFAVLLYTTPSDTQKSQTATYSNTEFGLEFQYKAGPDGYVLEETTDTSSKAGAIKTITLLQAKDDTQNTIKGGEQLPTISILIFKNSKKQFPLAWANENKQYSTMNLIQGQVSEAVIGGANAIRYVSDGLYATDTVIVAHGDSMYVLHGQYIDTSSSLKKDFEALLQSVRFIPTQISGSTTETFSGTITAVDTGCFYDAVCSVSINGKKVVLVKGGRGMSPDIKVGKLLGVESIGDLEQKIGSHANVYATTTPEGEWSLYGNDQYFVEVVTVK